MVMIQKVGNSLRQQILSPKSTKVLQTHYPNQTHLVANGFNVLKWVIIENRIEYLAASNVFSWIDGQAPDFERVNKSDHYNFTHSINALIFPNLGYIAKSRSTLLVPKSRTLCLK